MIVGVMASGDKPENKGPFTIKYGDLAKEVGAALATQGFDLLTGGGHGLMEIVGETFLNTKPRTGKLISILRAKEKTQLTYQLDKEKNPAAVEQRFSKQPWKWAAKTDNGRAEITIRTHLPYSGGDGTHELSRNHINILTSDLIIFLPGGDGTLSELQLAIQYTKPILLYLGQGTIGKTAPKNASQLEEKFGGLPFARVKSAANMKGLKEWLCT
jgi:predicted Rossmann-fold nucleotide-binding protein